MAAFGSCFSDKLSAALGAADIDSSLSPWNTHHLAAVRAGKIAILTVFNSGKKIEEPGIFLVALLQISGVHAINR